MGVVVCGSRFGVWVAGFRLRLCLSRVQGVGFLVSGFWFLVSDFWSLVSCFWLQVSGFGFRISDFGFQIPGFWFLIPGFGFSVYRDVARRVTASGEDHLHAPPLRGQRRWHHLPFGLGVTFPHNIDWVLLEQVSH